MSEPIKVGDLVVVVRRACGCGKGPRSLGRIFVVQQINNQLTNCSGCGGKMVGPFARTGGKTRDNFGVLAYLAFAVWRLKRIPPLDELEGQRTEEDLREPA